MCSLKLISNYRDDDGGAALDGADAALAIGIMKCYFNVVPGTAVVASFGLILKFSAFINDVVNNTSFLHFMLLSVLFPHMKK